MSKQISVLVIDDSDFIRSMFLDRPELDGFDVSVAEDGQTGHDLARSVRPDLILLDWILPDIDGMEVLAQIKDDPDIKNIPVYMLTAKKTPSDVGQAICEGVEGYFAKPFDLESLTKTLRKKLTSSVPIENKK